MNRPKNAPTETETLRPRVVIDTSLWLLACAINTSGDAMSQVDRQLKEAPERQNPKKYRGFLARMLVACEVIVPTIVLRELKAIASGGILSRIEMGNLGKLVHRDNNADLEIIIDAMEGRTTPALPTKGQVTRQATIWERIRLMPDQTRRWHEKFEPFQTRVQAAAKVAKDMEDEEPWLRARRILKQRQVAFEKKYTPHLSSEIQKWERETHRTWPDLIPDYEILLVAEAAEAPVASRDKDYQLMWLASPELSQKLSLKPIVV